MKNPESTLDPKLGVHENYSQRFRVQDHATGSKANGYSTDRLEFIDGDYANLQNRAGFGKEAAKRALALGLTEYDEESTDGSPKPLDLVGDDNMNTEWLDLPNSLSESGMYSLGLEPEINPDSDEDELVGDEDYYEKLMGAASVFEVPQAGRTAAFRSSHTATLDPEIISDISHATGDFPDGFHITHL